MGLHTDSFTFTYGTPPIWESSNAQVCVYAFGIFDYLNVN
jgi:hypothetical protein